MQVRCVRAFGGLVPGDEAEVPDGSVVDPDHFETVVIPPPPDPPAVADPPAAPASIPSASAVTPKEM